MGLQQAGGPAYVGHGPRTDAGGQVARSLAEAAELTLAQRPVHDDGLRGAGLHRHGRVGDGGAGPAPAGKPRQAGVAQLGQPQIGGHERRFVAVLGERRQAVDVVGAHAGIGDGAEHGFDRQLVLAGIGDPAPLGVAGLTDPDHAGGAPLGGHRVDHSTRTSSVCSPSNGGRRAITQGDPWARKGAPA